MPSKLGPLMDLAELLTTKPPNMSAGAHLESASCRLALRRWERSNPSKNPLSLAQFGLQKTKPPTYPVVCDESWRKEKDKKQPLEREML